MKAVDSIFASHINKTFDLRNLTTELPNVAFSINRDLFIRDVFFVAIRKEGNVSVSITTDSRLADITSETLTVIKIPKETFLETPETLYSALPLILIGGTSACTPLLCLARSSGT